ARLFNATIEVVPAPQWEEYKAEIRVYYQDQARREQTRWYGTSTVPESVWASLEYGKASRHEGTPDFWTKLHDRLERLGYYEQMKTSDERILKVLEDLPHLKRGEA